MSYAPKWEQQEIDGERERERNRVDDVSAEDR
jgi:hypothetical protein